MEKEVEFHMERIKCPNCNRFQQAKVEHTIPFGSYVHACKCGYIIMESEWKHIPATPKKEKKKPDLSKKHLFRDSPYFEITQLTAAFWGTKYEHANIEYYHEAALNWSDSGGNKKIDWFATIRGFMQRDTTKGKFIDKNHTPNHGKQSLSSRAQLGQEQLISNVREHIRNFDTNGSIDIEPAY